jgi:putative hemolysin
MSRALAQTLGVGGVVVAITYLSLIFGELVPKQIALRAPEASAARIAPLLNLIAVVAAPVVWLLDKSGKLVLALLGQSGEPDRGMTDEEVKLVISEAHSAGVMEKTETDMIAGVMRIADRAARGPHGAAARGGDGRHLRPARRHHPPLPRDRAFAPARARRRPRQHHRRPEVARLPRHRRGGPDRRAVGPDRGAGRARRDAALDVLETLRRAPAHMVLVYDEYGHFEGLITPMDVLEGIAGEFVEGEETEEKIVAREDGSLLVAGWMQADEFAERIGLTLEDDRDYETVAGLVIDRMGALPALGEHVDLGQWRIEVVDLDGRGSTSCHHQAEVAPRAPPGRVGAL